ncbi:MAG TPA: hypothetical protein DDY58_16025 [Terrisporobacter glycolicus]|uniref:hypothetical protein n=1 Tax=Terrisporobacter TaxID=1505652 RepID=UPI000E852051|nr:MULTISPECIES: hypothetical protein [Terrisporobacter]HBI93799.1 hypothetical protein [Terrisporobacter hibernicus]
MAQIKCTDNLTLDFSATYVVPASFGLVEASQFSIAVSTDSLIVYKDIVDYPVPPTEPVIGPCGGTIDNVVLKLGQVKVSGSIVYRVAANGIQTDPLIIPVELQDKVNVDDNIWSSADGFVDVVDGANNYMTVAFVLPEEDIDPSLLTVTLKSLVLGSTYIEERSNNRVITLEGQFELGYDLI